MTCFAFQSISDQNKKKEETEFNKWEKVERVQYHHIFFHFGCHLMTVQCVNDRKFQVCETQA